MRTIKSFLIFVCCFVCLMLSSCVPTGEIHEINNIDFTDTTVNVKVRILNSTYEKLYVVIINEGTEFDRKIVTKINNSYKLDYSFTGLMPNTKYVVNLTGVNGTEKEVSLDVSDFVTIGYTISNEITFENQTFDYTGLLIEPVVKNLPNDAIVVFTPEDIYDAGVYEVKAEILFEDNREMELNAVITVRKVSYPSDYVFNVLPSKIYTGSKIDFDYFLVDDFETVLTYKYNGNVVNEMVEAGKYQVELLIKESTNYLETVLTFDFEVVSKELDIFISEYFEGYYDKDYNPSGNNNDKALELFNPTENDIALSGYKICIYKSGSTNADYTVNLSGIIEKNATFVVVNQYASEELKKFGDMTGELYFSGKHTVALYHNNVLIDILGSIGQVYSVPMDVNGIIGAFADNRLIRKVGIAGNTTFTENEWIVAGNCEYNDLGKHVFKEETKNKKMYIYKMKEFELALI